MSLLEFFGFIVSLVGMLILFFKQAREKAQRNRNPAYYDNISEDPHADPRRLLRILGGEMIDDDEEQILESPKPLLQKKLKLSEVKPVAQPHPRRSYLSANEKDPYALTIRKESSRAARCVQQAQSLKNWVIVRELLGKPRGLEPWER